MFATFHVVKIRHQSFQDGKFVGFIIPRFQDFDGRNKDGMLLCSVNTIRVYLVDFSLSSKPIDTYLCQLVRSWRTPRKPLVGWGRWSACVEACNRCKLHVWLSPGRMQYFSILVLQEEICSCLDTIRNALGRPVPTVASTWLLSLNSVFHSIIASFYHMDITYKSMDTFSIRPIMVVQCVV